MQDSVRKSAVAAWPNRQKEIGCSRNRSHSWIDDDDLCAVVTRSPDVISKDGEAFANVRSGDHHCLCEWNVAPWVCRTIDAEGHFVCRAGANHTEPAVVVDVCGPQRDTRELAEEIGLFVRHRCAAQDGKRIAS